MPSEEPSDQLAAMPESLVDWLPTRVKSGSFLAYLKSGSGRLDGAAASHAARLVIENPDLLGRAADIVRSLERAPATLRGPLEQFARDLVESLVPGLSGWLRDENASSEDDLRRLARALGPELRRPEPQVRRRAEQLLAIGLAVLTSKRRIAPLVLLEAVADAYGLVRGEAVGDTRPARRASAALAGSKPKQLAQFAAVARLQEQRVSDAEAVAARETAKAVQAERAVQEIGRRLREQDEELAALRGETARLQAQLAEGQDRLKSVQSVGAHDAAGLRARFRRLLGEDIRGLAGDARDALEIDPPHPDFAKIYLGDMLEKIEGEIRWLNERSE